MSMVNDNDIFNKLSNTVLHLHILSHSNHIQASASMWESFIPHFTP